MKIAFDNAMIGDAAVTFSRDIATVSDAGNACAAGEPRYGSPAAFCDPLTWSDTGLNGTAGGGSIVGSGYDNDGVPMAVFKDSAPNLFKIIKGTPPAFANSVSYATNSDIMGGATPGKRYRPVTCVIHKGIILIQCERLEDTGGGYVVVGVSVVYSHDEFTTLDVIDFAANSAAAGADEGMSRCREYCFISITKAPHKSLDLEAWLPFADYLHKGGDPKGGQVFLIKLTRPDTDSHWSVTGRVIEDRWEPTDSGGHHCHGAGIVSTSPTAVKLLSAWGDVSYRQHMRVHSFTMDENWLTNTVTSELAHSRWSSTTTDESTSHQPTNLVPGPQLGAIVASGDESPQLVAKFGPLDDTDDPLPVWVSRRRDKKTGSGSGVEGLATIHLTYVPGLGYVGGGGSDQFYHASDDGEYWAEINQAPSGGGRVWIYGDSYLTQGSGDVYIAPRTSVRRYRPIQIARGCKNEISVAADVVQHSTPNPSSGATLRKVSYDAGTWKHDDDDSALDPQPAYPPPMDLTQDYLFLHMKQTDGGRTAGSWRISESGGGGDDISAPGCLDAWLMNLHPDRAFIFSSRGRSSGGIATSDRVREYGGYQQWQPVAKADDAGSAGYGYLQLYGGGNSSNTVSFDALFAIRGWHNGGVQPSYALAPQVTGPDELLTLPAQLDMASCSGRLVFRIPDHFSIATTVQTLATLYADASNYLEIIYNDDDLKLEATVGGVSAGEIDLVGDAYIGDTIDVAFSLDGATLTAGGRVGFGAFVTGSDTLSAAFSGDSVDLRFRDPTGNVPTIDVIGLHLTNSVVDLSTPAGVASLGLRDNLTSPLTNPIVNVQ